MAIEHAEVADIWAAWDAADARVRVLRRTRENADYDDSSTMMGGASTMRGRTAEVGTTSIAT